MVSVWEVIRFAVLIAARRAERMNGSPGSRRNTLGRLSLGLGLASAALVGVLTVAALWVVVTGRVEAVEQSRSLNLGFALLAICGEAVALVGGAAGAAALFQKRRRRLAALVGLALSAASACLFFPAAATLLQNSLFGLIELMTRSTP